MVWNEDYRECFLFLSDIIYLRGTVAGVVIVVTDLVVEVVVGEATIHVRLTK